MVWLERFTDPRFLSLTTLTIQTTVAVLAMKASRIPSVDGTPMYLASVAVLLDESLKLVACVALLYLAYRQQSKETAQYDSVPGPDEEASIEKSPLPTRSFVMFFRVEVFVSFIEFGKMAVPAFLYSVQKNLLFIGVSNLDAGTFQVLQQGKILTTALFAVIILKKTLNSRQIWALGYLVLGAALVQLSTLDSGANRATTTHEVPLVGFIAVLAACFTSGFASIYFEWILKNSTDRPKPSYDVWVRNFQLATFGTLSAALGVILSDRDKIWSIEGGLLQGFTPLVWFVVCIQAFGGLVVALVIKYADNILKNFASSIAIVSAVLLSVLFMGFVLTITFSVGAVCVILAIMLYTSDPNSPIIPSWAREQAQPLQSEIKT